MCGKFTQMMSWAQLHNLADLVGGADDREVLQTPMSFAVVVRAEDGARTVRPMRWGFAELHAKAPMDKPGHLHARAETIDTLPTFAGAFAHNRGVVFVKTFNIGEELPGGKVKQHVVHADGAPLALAVLWERWTNRDEGELFTYVMVTTAANPMLATRTDRMPAVLTPEQIPVWLGETGATLAEIKALLVPYAGALAMHEQVKAKPPRPQRTRADDPQGALF